MLLLKDMKQEAANMMNVVRQRAGAEFLAASDINIGTVLTNVHVKLYYEENRHVELSCISYNSACSLPTLHFFS